MKPDLFRLNFDMEPKHWWFVARRRIFRQIISEVLVPSPQTTIVDVGCGTGGNIGSLGDDYRCVGIDPSPEAIELARERYPRVRFIAGEAPEDLGDVARQAKLFLLTDVLEHVPDDLSLLSRLLAAASPGAYFLITVPANMSLWSPHDESHGHYRRYDRQGFEQLWRGLPVEPLLLSHFNTRLYHVVKLTRAVNRRLGKTAGPAATDVKLPWPLANRFLERIFSGEGEVLKNLLRGKRRRGYPFGVSLIALIRREAGEIPEPRKPLPLVTDQLEPAADQLMAGHA